MFGEGNLGSAFKAFPVQHECNEFCDWFGLPPAQGDSEDDGDGEEEGMEEEEDLEDIYLERSAVLMATGKLGDPVSFVC